VVDLRLIGLVIWLRARDGKVARFWQKRIRHFSAKAQKKDHILKRVRGLNYPYSI
jgi:hypothetical protein